MKVEGLIFEKLKGLLRRKSLNEYKILDWVHIKLFNGDSYKTHLNIMNKMGPDAQMLALFIVTNTYISKYQAVGHLLSLWSNSILATSTGVTSLVKF